MDQFRGSLDPFSGKTTSYRVHDYHTIHLHLHSACALLFNQQLAPSFNMTVPLPPPISSFYVHLKKREFLACVLRSPHLPGAPFCRSSSNIHPLPLSLRDHYCQSCYWPEDGDGCMVLLFQSFFFFLLYLCIIHRHTTTTPFKESGLKQNDSLFFFLFFLEIIKSAVPGLTVGNSEAIKVSLF